MSSFETSSLELAARSTECLELVRELNASLDGFLETADANIQDLDSQFNELQDIGKEALEALTTLEDELIARLEKFGANCSNTLELISATRSSYEEQYQTAKGSAEESDTHIKEMESNQALSWESVSLHATALLEGYSDIANHLAAFTSEVTGEITSQVGSMLTEIPSRLQEETTTFGESIEEENVTKMMEEASQFTSKIEDVGASIKEGLQELGSLMEEGVTDTLESMYSTYEETISDIIDTANDLVETFNSVSDKVSDSVDSVGNTFDMIDEVTDATNIGLNSAMKVFEEAEKLLDRIIG